MHWSPYYQHLSTVMKKRFIRRSIRFYRTVEFTSHNSLALSMQMKIIISSAFIQITFGLRKHRLRDFTSVVVMPRAYSYFQNKLYYSGDVNPSLYRITLSWAAVKRGFEIHDDALNVCIHEFGHCLLLENRSSFLYYFFNYSAWEAYKVEAKKKFQKIKSGNNRVLRDYGGTNLMEFFSVALEAFFEQPQLLAQEEPNLYLSMCQLLKQDPRRKNRPIL